MGLKSNQPAIHMSFAPLNGLVAAPFTAFHKDGSLNLDLIEAQAQSLIANGVSGAFVCGTTGEGASMTVEERMAVAARWCEVAGSQLRVIVHVGHTALGDCQALAAHAAGIGAAGVGSIAPFFFKPSKVDDLVLFCSRVAATVPEMPFYYYQIPSMTGVGLCAADFLKRAGGTIPNLAGVKFTHENLMDFLECVQFDGGRFDVVFGRDEILLGAMSLGARGAIGSTYNFAAPVYDGLMKAFYAGSLELARAEQSRANKMIDVFSRYGGLPAGKSIMRLIGLDCGPVRLPLRSLSEEREAELRADLERVGFFDFCSTV